MKRVVEPEWLDELPANDPRAVASRRDLRNLNFFMGNVGIIERTLIQSFSQPPQRIVELGAGDGTFALQLARRLSRRWPHLEMVLIDQQRLVSAETENAFQKLGWKPHVVCADIFEWLPHCGSADGMFANLFLHHFEREKLSVLLGQAAAKTNVFVACEPRRSALGIFGTKLIWALGCNDVTRHDAPASVRAGFRGVELSELWPRTGAWEIDERRTGVFSHRFSAKRG